MSPRKQKNRKNMPPQPTPSAPATLLAIKNTTPVQGRGTPTKNATPVQRRGTPSKNATPIPVQRRDTPRKIESPAVILAGNVLPLGVQQNEKRAGTQSRITEFLNDDGMAPLTLDTEEDAGEASDQMSMTSSQSQETDNSAIFKTPPMRTSSRSLFNSGSGKSTATYTGEDKRFGSLEIIFRSGALSWHGGAAGF